jgi:tryptophan-rich sensory protein
VAVWRAWRVLKADEAKAAGGLVAGYLGQLFFNALWSVLFFGLKQPAWALADIAVLWALLVWLQVRLFRTEPLAGWLWLPYVLWVSFASALNLAIVRLN